MLRDSDRALQCSGHTVGYLGDGINDAPALHAADVSISEQEVVDVARESADVILLSPGLDVLRQGVEEGRRTFANTLEYVSITTRANFGNMISMALATPFLPFLPLAARQILLNNFLSDLPSIAISTDPLLTEFAAALVLRTRNPLFRSRPGLLLPASTCIVIIMALALPYIGSGSAVFGFVALPASALWLIAAIVPGYVIATELTKRWHFRNVRGGDPRIPPANPRLPRRRSPDGSRGEIAGA